MMNEATQREIASLLLKELSGEGLEAVLVGSSAVVALDLFPRSSKDADALAPPGVSLDEGRRTMRAIGERFHIEPTEVGEGTISLIQRGEAGEIVWRMDLIVPGDGLIPSAAATLIHKRAKKTVIGRAAIAEHLLAMKAIAYGDCVGKGIHDRAAEYKRDVEALRAIPARLDLRLTEGLLSAFPDVRRDAAVRLINETFGTKFRESPDPSV